MEASNLKRAYNVVPVLELSLRAVWNRSGRKAAHMAVWSPALALEHVGINLPIGGPKEQELVARRNRAQGATCPVLRFDGSNALVDIKIPYAA